MKPWKSPYNEKKKMLAIFATAWQNMTATYLNGKHQKKDKVPTEEFNNLNLEKDA